MQETEPMSRSRPEDQGVSPAGLQSFLVGVQEAGLELHSFMLVRHGHVVSEAWWAPYAAERPHLMWSVSKSFTATAIGLAVDEGRLSLEDAVVSFFPDEMTPQIRENMGALRVRHLLSMSTGHATDTMPALHGDPDGNWVRGFFSVPIVHSPGTHFLYNTGASYMLSAILQQVTGETLLDYLQPRLFAPLGIPRPTWASCPRGINLGGFGLSVHTEDLARFGQLYLQEGRWNTETVLSSDWIAEATSRHVSNGDDPDSDWAQGYGFQFWRCRHGAYRADGAFGQFCVVLPEQDAVVVMTGGEQDMQAMLNQVWDHLLPAMTLEPLARQEAQYLALQQQAASLVCIDPVPVRADIVASPCGSRVDYVLEENVLQAHHVHFEFTNERFTVTLETEQGNVVLPGLYNGWTEVMTEFLSPAGEPRRTLTHGTWTAPEIFTLSLCQVETPFRWTIHCVFEPDTVQLQISVNVSFDPATRHRVLTGRICSASSSPNV